MGSLLEATGGPAPRGQTVFRPGRDDSPGLTRNGLSAPARAGRKEAGMDPRSKF